MMVKEDGSLGYRVWYKTEPLPNHFFVLQFQHLRTNVKDDAHGTFSGQRHLYQRITGKSKRVMRCDARAYIGTPVPGQGGPRAVPSGAQ
ncbi:hypothetical protein V493_01237 [Pseudogymnoascus sp. VKM F-4281 (FW-2241)]|nr:hypothetical protein V493_01237 [Pseudogymnoascus sp. VKM F-4281 (FW-2241)]